MGKQPAPALAFMGPILGNPTEANPQGQSSALEPSPSGRKRGKGRDTRWSQPPALTVVRGEVPGGVPLTLRAGVPRDAAFMPGFVLMSEASPGGDRAGASPLLSSPLPAAPCARRSSNQGRDFRDS